ncbi:MAG: DUF1549 domain-containing protein [Armatimonadetes bacterium]|nr:DUF1549 domain-containing protein [Armatimonadota bacterium]MDE2207205.1 DUF1549 domain-containing protein [Armatimonadota bacterium]
MNLSARSQIGPLALAALLAVPAGALAGPARPAKVRRAAHPRSAILSITAVPATIALTGPRADAHYIVMARLGTGALLDVTSRARPLFQGKAVAGISSTTAGLLTPIRDGVSTLVLKLGAHTAHVRVTVTGATANTPVSFSNEVEPVLTRIGCNQGACHGAQFGQSGFKLSLFGTDHYLDYDSITRQARGRRVSLTQPDQSLILLKPTMTVPHGGGRRLIPGSSDYKLVAQWIREGAPPPLPTDPDVESLTVLPAQRLFTLPMQQQHLVVLARYTDGTVRDVTDQAVFTSLNDAIASCSPSAVVTAAGRGQTAVMVRYGGQAAVTTCMLPYSSSRIAARQTFPPDDFIDRLAAQKQAELGLVPSPLCSDRTFIRRVSFDLIGTAPRQSEVAAFVADPRPDKRSRLIDSLLRRPEYADYWVVKWGDLLRCNRTTLGVKGMWSFHNWIHRQLAKNVPMDQFVRSMLLAQGSTYTDGPANFYRVSTDPESCAETTSQVFLGVRLQCARCHHHPFEKWSQDDYYQFSAFFARVGRKGSADFGIFGNDQVIKVDDHGQVRNPADGKVMEPEALGVVTAALPDGKMPDPDSGGDRRVALANWVTSPTNPLLARNLANRYWAYMMGQGLVNPIDDQRTTNPPSNPALLNALAGYLVSHNFNIKALLRVICNSEAYQRSSQATVANSGDSTFYTHYVPKRLPAEPLLDAVDYACGSTEHFPTLPSGMRAIDLPDPNISSDFLDVFGRPQRVIACECERNVDPNLSQALTLMNGDVVNRKVEARNGRIPGLIREGASDNDILNQLYQAALARPPTARERDIALGFVAFSPDRQGVFQDILLSLLNSKEFLFNH